MLSFRRKSTLPVGGKSDSASSPLPPTALADTKAVEHDIDHEDIFSAVLSSASNRQQPPTQPTAAVDEQSREKLADEEKDGKLTPSPLPFNERASIQTPAQPSLSKPDITPDTLRAITAVSSVDREGMADEWKEAGQQHARKTSSSALIAEILGTKTADTLYAAAPTTASANTVLCPPPLLSGASMSVEAPQRKELPVFNMREYHGELLSPAAPPPTPTALPVAPSKPPPPLNRSPPPPPPRTVPPPISVVSSNPFADGASPTTSAAARLPPIAPTAALSRSPPPRPTFLSPASSIPSSPHQPASAEGVPNGPYVAAVVGGTLSNPFDDGDEEEVEGSVRSAVSVGRSRVVAVAAYSASAADQLSCVAGEVLEVADDSHSNWTLVCNVQGRRGLVPASYVRKQRMEEESSSTAAVPPPAKRQSSTTSHRRTASQPPLQLLGYQQRSSPSSVPTSPVRFGPPPVPTSPSTSPPSNTLRLPPPSPAASSAPLALRLPQPPPPSHPAPPALPRPLSSPSSPVLPSPPSPVVLSPLLSQRPRSPSVPTASYARPTTATVLPTSASFSSSPLFNGSVAESAVPAPAMEVCEAAHSYSAVAADQLSLTVGEKLLLVDRHHPHWWKVVNGAGDTGLVPTTYIKLLDTPSGAASSFAPLPKPPQLPPPTQPFIHSPPAGAVSVSVPSPLVPIRSLSPPIAPRPSPPAVLPVGPAPPQPPTPPPLNIPLPLRQSQQQVATTATATTTPQPLTTASVPQHRHSMSLNTISAPIKRTPPAALTTASAPATPSNGRAAAVEPPSFPLPPTPAARTSPMPPPPARPPPPTTLTITTATQPAATAAAAVSQSAAVMTGTLVAERGEAVHSFDATDGVQLSVSRGDVLLILQRLETGWAVCRQLHTGITGLVPTSYIRSTTDRATAG